eukprot:TRINITY_DN8652_c0_g1_i6.p2 TRINITY_DN8652_c0_g1~~TRINITY_DN8652_c0_g1_i6.p2  ORF type:complete len:265 (-),score=26.78 TRINITY_DN8652_c0_g1_i6:1168-1962(-)
MLTLSSEATSFTYLYSSGYLFSLINSTSSLHPPFYLSSTPYKLRGVELEFVANGASEAVQEMVLDDILEFECGGGENEFGEEGKVALKGFFVDVRGRLRCARLVELSMLGPIKNYLVLSMISSSSFRYGLSVINFVLPNMWMVTSLIEMSATACKNLPRTLTFLDESQQSNISSSSSLEYSFPLAACSLLSSSNIRLKASNNSPCILSNTLTRQRVAIRRAKENSGNAGNPGKKEAKHLFTKMQMEERVRSNSIIAAVKAVHYL